MKNTTNTNLQSTSKKKSSSRKGLATGIMLTAGVLATNLGTAQTQNKTIANKKDSSAQIDSQSNKQIYVISTLNDSLPDYEKLKSFPIKRLDKHYDPDTVLNIVKICNVKDINNIRKQLGLNELIIDDNLMQAAQKYAEEMYNNKRFSHTGKNGDNWTKRAKKAGYTGTYVYENIGKDYYSIETAIKNRKESPAHYSNMTNSKITHIGVGYYKGYRVNMFGGK